MASSCVCVGLHLLQHDGYALLPPIPVLPSMSVTVSSSTSVHDRLKLKTFKFKFS